MSAVLVALVSTVVQLLYIVDIRDDPTFDVPVIDAAVYERGAEAFARGESMEPGAPYWQPPLLPFMLGCAYIVTGVHPATMRVLLVGLACAGCVLTWALGRRLYSDRVGLIAGLALALYGPFLFYSQQLLPASPAIVLTLAAMLTLCGCVAAHRGLWLWGFHGALIGLATINVPTAAALLGASVWAALRTPRRSRERTRRRAVTVLTRIAALAVGFMPPVLAVAVRNLREGRAWVWVSTNGGVNLFLGNNADWRDTIAIRPGPDWDRLVREPLAAGAISGQAQGDYFARKAWRFMVDEPAAFARGLLIKSWMFLHSNEIPRNTDLYAAREWSLMLRLLCWRIGGFAFPWGVVGPLTVVGVTLGAVARRRSRRSRIRRYVLLAAGLYALGVILVFPTSRYRMPVVPVAMVFALGGLLSLWNSRRRQRHAAWRSAKSALAAGVLAAVAMNLPIHAPTDRVNFTADLFYQVASEELSAGRTSQADVHLRQALSRQPTHAPSIQSLARLRMSQGRLSEAEAWIDRLAINAAGNARPSSLLCSLRGDLVREKKDLQRASEFYRDALTDDPTDPEALLALGLLARMHNDAASAEDFLRRASRMGLRTGQADIVLGDLLVERSEYAEAIQAYRRGLWLVRPTPDLLERVARLLATCPLQELREPEKAVELAEAAVAMAGDDPDAYDALGTALRSAGRSTEAADAWHRALSLARGTGNMGLAAAVEEKLHALGGSRKDEAGSHH